MDPKFIWYMCCGYIVLYYMIGLVHITEEMLSKFRKNMCDISFEAIRESSLILTRTHFLR